MSLLEVSNLGVRLGKAGLSPEGGRSREVLRDISFALVKGETLGIIGESGSGKTTLVRCIAGLVRPTSGRIEFMDYNLFPASRNRRRVKPKIQLLFQDHSASLDPRMMIGQSMLYLRAKQSESQVEITHLIMPIQLPRPEAY